MRCRVKTVLALLCSLLQKDDSVIGDRWVLRVGLRLLLQQQQAEHILRFCCLNLSEQRSKVIHHKCYKQFKKNCSGQPFGQMKNGLLSHQIKPNNFKKYSNLDLNLEFSSRFRMYAHQKTWKVKEKNPWIRPWFNILMWPHPIYSDWFTIFI